MKRDYLRELWINKPWVYIPDVIRFMRDYPYNKKTDYFKIWLWNCLYVNWQVAWRE